MKTAPMPSEVRIIAGRTFATYEPSTGSCVSSPSPSAVRIIPTAATGRTPIFGAKLEARPAETMTPAVNGRNARPGLERLVAEHALDVERVEEEHREHPRHREEHHDVGRRE